MPLRIPRGVEWDSRVRPMVLQLFPNHIIEPVGGNVMQQYEVEVTIIGTAKVCVTADSRDEAMSKAEESTTVMHGEDWCYDATGVREHWVAETPAEELVVGA